jgi:Fic family protein
MGDDYKRIEAKLSQLKALRSLKPKSQGSLEAWFDIELTYSSNAIEGNTLTRIETAEVIEKGINVSIPGKPLKDLLEARNHQEALLYVKGLASKLKSHQFIRESELLTIHKTILKGIDDNWAGRYRQSEVFVKGSRTAFPYPEKVPFLMSEFYAWLNVTQGESPVKIAADAHYKFVTIHPFVDGNGRVARLLMNLVLAIHSYPMAVIKNEERSKYLSSLEKVQTTNDIDNFYHIVNNAVEKSLDAYIKFYSNENPIPKDTMSEKFLRIGELSKQTGETIHTLHFWIKEGLIKFAKRTEGGYQLFDKTVVDKVKEIRSLQKNQRLTLSEIRHKLRAIDGELQTKK